MTQPNPYPQPSENEGGRGPPIRTGVAAGAGGGEPPGWRYSIRPQPWDPRWAGCLWGAVLGLGLGSYLVVRQPGGFVGGLIGAGLALRFSHAPHWPGPDVFKVILAALVGGGLGQVVLGVGLRLGTDSPLERVVGAPLGTAAALGALAALSLGLELWRERRARNRVRKRAA